MNPKFVYFGTPDFSTFVLDELRSVALTPVLVVTTPDKPADRGLEMKESPVKMWAKNKNIPTLQPEQFDEHILEQLRNVSADFFVVAAYGKILPSSVLAIPTLGNLNVHPSLLPRYRGTSPVESQILADEKEVGVSIILMDEKMDHGPVVAQKRIEIPDWPVSRSELNALLWHTGGKLLSEIIPKWVEGEVTPREQDHSQATFTKKMTKEDGCIDLTAPGKENYLRFLAYEGWPGTYFFTDHGGRNLRVKIKTATFENGTFIPLRIVPEGKKEMNYADFIRT